MALLLERLASDEAFLLPFFRAGGEADDADREEGDGKTPSKPLERTRSHQFTWHDAMEVVGETKKDEGYQTLEGIVSFSSEILGRYPPNTVVQTIYEPVYIYRKTLASDAIAFCV